MLTFDKTKNVESINDGITNVMFDELYALSSTNKVKKWSIDVSLTIDGYGDICVRHGYIDGKVQENHRIIKKGKNIGKKNETTPFEQAVKEAKSKWNAKKDQNYQEEIPNPGDAPKFDLPMLAHNYKDRKHNIKYDAYVQPKLNGVRCFAKRIKDDIFFQSRKGKVYTTLEHMKPELLDILEPGEILDGEIYYHGWTFQKIVSAVKKVNNDTPSLEFHAYDLAIPKEGFTFIERYFELIRKLVLDDTGGFPPGLPKDYKYIVLTKTTRVKNEEQIIVLHDKFVQSGYEGAIIRNTEGLYRFNYRSPDLQKYKEFEDKEFEIIDGVSGTGIEEGCIIFVCKNEDGKLFRVRPKGTRELRRQWLMEIESIYGKELTVRYQERSEDNIPIFPVGIAIRDYE